MTEALFESDLPALAEGDLPTVWAALGDLCASDATRRREALGRLQTLDAVRRSVVVACFLASRLEEPEMDLRCEMIAALSSVMDGAARAEVRQAARAELRRMRRRPIFALLQAAEHDPDVEEDVARLLSANPFAGATLADLLEDRRMPLPIRRQAARFIGRVGFLDARPALERVVRRLESRQRAQARMPFAPQSPIPEEGLLPAVREALAALRAPV